jgi:hypothetical protein
MKARLCIVAVIALAVAAWGEEGDAVFNLCWNGDTEVWTMRGEPCEDPPGSVSPLFVVGREHSGEPGPASVVSADGVATCTSDDCKFVPKHPSTSFACFERRVEIEDACDLVHYAEFEALEKRVRALEDRLEIAHPAQEKPPWCVEQDGCEWSGAYCICTNSVDWIAPTEMED